MKRTIQGCTYTENPKKEQVVIRLDEYLKEQLDECAALLNVSKSDIIRKGIAAVYDVLKK